MGKRPSSASVLSHFESSDALPSKKAKATGFAKALETVKKAPVKKAVTKKAPVKKAKPAPKRKVVESSDDEAMSEGDLSSPVARKTPRPGRSRKVVSYAAAESSEGEESDYAN